MVKKLRRKFVTVAMAAVFCVLALLIGLINVINFNSVNKYADERLEVLINNDGVFPRIDDFRGDSRLPMRDMSPEAPFDTRYFTVTVHDDGTILTIDTGKIAAVSTESAADYAERIYVSGGDGGFVEDYKYTAVDTEDGIMYIFLDCGRELDTFRSFLGASLGISSAGFILVFILVWMLSGIALKPAEESYKKQSRFITDAGHEIKTPLTIIDAATELIEMENGGSKWTASIKSQVARLTRLTEKLVLLTRMDEDSESVDKREFCLSDTVEDVVQSFEAIALSRDKKLIYKVPFGVMYKGNEELLRQMLSLLIDNAVKYSNDGGIITVDLIESGRAKQIIVSNTVSGIEIGDHKELFERFYRTDSSRNSETGGYGIGLSVVDAIVRVHGGKVSAVSEDGRSIKFTVIL